MLNGMNIEVIAIHSNSIAAHPVSIPLPRCIAVFNEHPLLSVNCKDGTGAKLAQVAWVADVEIGQVAIAQECEVTLILVSENGAEEVLGVLNGVRVVTHVGSFHRCCLTVAAIGVGALRVRLVATTDTLEYCLSGNVGQERRECECGG